YSSTGIPLWTNYYNGVGNESLNAMAIDRDGNVTVTGVTAGAFSDYATVKYASSARPYLKIDNIGNKAVLSWTASGFVFQSTPSFQTSFTNIDGASSPYTNLDNVRRYFRLKSN